MSDAPVTEPEEYEAPSVQDIESADPIATVAMVIGGS